MDFEPSEGLLILEVQHRTYTFLERCCEELLHELPTTERAAEWTSLDDPNREASYRAPMPFDFGEFKSFMAAEMSACAGKQALRIYFGIRLLFVSLG